MTNGFKGVIDLDVRDSTPDWSPFVAEAAPEGAPPERVREHLGGRVGFPGLQLAHPFRTRSWPRCCASAGGTPSGSARTTTSRSTSGRWAAPSATGRWRAGSTASTASSAARPTSGIPTSPRTTSSSNSPTCPRTATTSPRTWPTRRSRSSATPSSRIRRSHGSRSSAPAPTTLRTMRRRSGSTSTRACSTTAMRPTASGSCRGWSSAILPAIVIYAADNGASGEGSPTGSVNENKFFNGFPDDVEENLTMLDKLGSPDTYNHYPTGWAAAFSTPFRMFKRYSYLGGVSDPLVIHWPAGIKAAGEVRDQYHHVIDIVPTILNCRGVELPDTVNRLRPDAAARRIRCATRSRTGGREDGQDGAVLRDDGHAGGSGRTGWRAVTVHGPQPINKGHFDEDVWQLFHIDTDRSEAHRPSPARSPERLKEMIALWNSEAEKYGVLPLSDARGSPVSLALEVQGAGPAQRGLQVATRRRWRVPSAAPPTPTASRTASSREVDLTERGRESVIMGPRVALRRPRAVHQGPPAALRLQLPRHPPGAAPRPGKPS